MNCIQVIVILLYSSFSVAQTLMKSTEKRQFNESKLPTILFARCTILSGNEAEKH